MAEDLEFTSSIVGCPLIREEDGLAMSSRNVRLSNAGRVEALAISRALFHAADLYREGKAVSEVQSALMQKLQPLQVEYAELCDADTLEPLTAERQAAALIAVAAYVDGVRLIDNVLLK
jgi:pantoate--beta-alanine ligase